MYKVIVIDDEMLVRRGIVMETDWQKPVTALRGWKLCGNIIRIC